MEPNVNLEPILPERTTQSERFNGFAYGHFMVSGIGFVVGLIICIIGTATSGKLLPWVVLGPGVTVLMLCYAVAGWLTARNNVWTFPRKFREGLWAFLAPALVAWAWAGLILLLAYLPGGFASMALLLVAASIFLASPSFMMVLLGLTLDMLAGWPSLLVLALLAGGIPPLFFLLGSLWGSRKSSAAKEPKGEDCAKEEN